MRSWKFSDLVSNPAFQDEVSRESRWWEKKKGNHLQDLLSPSGHPCKYWTDLTVLIWTKKRVCPKIVCRFEQLCGGHPSKYWAGLVVLILSSKFQLKSPQNWPQNQPQNYLGFEQLWILNAFLVGFLQNDSQISRDLYQWFRNVKLGTLF